MGNFGRLVLACRAGIPDELMFILSGGGEIVISEVFYISSTNSKGVRTNSSASSNQTADAVTHKSPEAASPTQRKYMPLIAESLSKAAISLRGRRRMRPVVLLQDRNGRKVSSL